MKIPHGIHINASSCLIKIPYRLLNTLKFGLKAPQKCRCLGRSCVGAQPTDCVCSVPWSSRSPLPLSTLKLRAVPLLLAHPTPLPPCSGAVSGSRHVRCLGAARSLLSNCFAAPSRMWARRGGCARGRLNSRSVFGEGMGEARRGERSENREEEGERMLPCLFSDLYWSNCAGLAKSGAELPSPPLPSPPGRHLYLGLNALIPFSFNLLLIDLDHVERSSASRASGCSGCKIAP